MDVIEVAALDFDEEFMRIDSLISEYDTMGEVALREGASAFQWGTIEEACARLLNKMPDIRVAIWYVRASMTTRGLSGLADSISRLAEIMNLPADVIHPRAQRDESASELHALHLGWLSGSAFLHQVGLTRIEEAQVTLGYLVNTHNSVVGGMRPDQRTAMLCAVDVIELALRQIEAAMLRAEQPIDVSRVLAMLSRVRVQGSSREMRDVVPGSATLSDSESHEKCGAGCMEQVALHSRHEVEVALERIEGYFRVHEPSHPAPIFLARIRRMLGAPFEDLMAELYPDSAVLLAQLERPAKTA